MLYVSLQAKLEKVLDDLLKSKEMNTYLSNEHKGSLPSQPVDTDHIVSLLNEKGDLL